MNQVTGSANRAGNPKDSAAPSQGGFRDNVIKFMAAYTALMEQQRNTLPSNHIALADAAKSAAEAVVKGASNG